MRASERVVASLAVAAQAGDEHAWLELMARFDGMVHGAAASFWLQDADAADMVQTTWLSALARALLQLWDRLARRGYAPGRFLAEAG